MFKFLKKSKIKESKRYAVSNQKVLSVLEVEGKVKDHLINYFSQIATNESSESGNISSKTMLALIAGPGGGAILGSSALSSNLFVATVNPASLMKIGAGFGSAVVTKAGIVGQAAFIPASAAVLPIALPVIAFQAISTLVILNQFKAVNKRLDDIDKNIRKLLIRDEASFAGEILYAVQQLDLLEKQHNVSKRFTDEMLLSLCGIKDMIGPSLERYRILYESEKIASTTSAVELKQKHHDSHFLVALTVLELRADLLKIKYAVEVAPEQLEVLTENFKRKSKFFKELWSMVKSDAVLVGKIAENLSDAIELMNWWERHLPAWAFGKKKERLENELSLKKMIEHNKNIRGTIDPLVKVGESIADQFGDEKNFLLVYWKDDDGREHSYYIAD